jgi:hypothetical protein
MTIPGGSGVKALKAGVRGLPKIDPQWLVTPLPG